MTRAVTALLECVGRRPGLPNAKTFEGFSDSDWRELIQTARRQRLLALLHQRVQTHDLARSMPEEMAEQCRVAARFAAMRGLRLRAELSAIGRMFLDAGIPVIVLKGGHLAWRFYDNLSLRWMDDLDLLVPQEDLARAVAVLEAAGYRSQRELPLDVTMAAHHHAAPLSRAGYLVELHWSIVPPDDPVAVDLEALWSRSVPLDPPIPGMRALSVNDLLVHLCVHAACVHGLSTGFQPLVDIAEVSHATQVDWAGLQTVARVWRAVRPVSLTLQLARELAGAAVPEVADPLWILETADASVVAAAKDSLVARTNGPVSANVLRLGALGARQQVEAAARALSPARVAYMHGLRRQGSWRLPLLQAWRGVELLWRYGGSLMRFALNDRQFEGGTQERARLLGWLRGSA